MGSYASHQISKAKREKNDSICLTKAKLKKIPDPLYKKLGFLKNLDLGCNFLTEVGQISSLSNLQHLSLTHNKFKKIPSQITELLSLKVQFIYAANIQVS